MYFPSLPWIPWCHQEKLRYAIHLFKDTAIAFKNRSGQEEVDSTPMSLKSWKLVFDILTVPFRAIKCYKVRTNGQKMLQMENRENMGDLVAIRV